MRRILIKPSARDEKEDVKVTVENRRVDISERTEVWKEEKKRKYHRVEPGTAHHAQFRSADDADSSK